MKATLRKLWEDEQERHQLAIEALAEQRLDDFEREWKQTRKAGLELVFGMGCFDALGPNGDTDTYSKYFGRWPMALEQLEQDLDDITDQFRAACPNGRKINL